MKNVVPPGYLLYDFNVYLKVSIFSFTNGEMRKEIASYVSNNLTYRKHKNKWTDFIRCSVCFIYLMHFISDANFGGEMEKTC
jgi:hypothetical protein